MFSITPVCWAFRASCQSARIRSIVRVARRSGSKARTSLARLCGGKPRRSGVADKSMPSRQFANQKALIDYVERNGLVYVWGGTSSFAKRQRMLSREQYEIVEVRTHRRGVTPAMLFAKAILQAEWVADAPFREAMAIKGERWRALRAEKKKVAEEKKKLRPLWAQKQKKRKRPS